MRFKIKFKKFEEMTIQELQKEALYGKFMAYLGCFAATLFLCLDLIRNFFFSVKTIAAETVSLAALMFIVAILGAMQALTAKIEIRLRRLAENE